MALTVSNVAAMAVLTVAMITSSIVYRCSSFSSSSSSSLSFAFDSEIIHMNKQNANANMNTLQIRVQSLLSRRFRSLEELDPTTPSETSNETPNENTGWKGNLLSPAQWELYNYVYTSLVLVLMFVTLISDRVGADMVMIGVLTLYAAGQIISIDEALSGFMNQGLWSVMVLLVVAEGISKTGALDWYMGKLLGRPKTASIAQLKLMAPMAIISAFLNNTPVVAVMIPIVQKWSLAINISSQQLLIPLSFASILGGTCTLIGTSTNLIVAGLLAETFPDNPNMMIGLFDLSVYGIPLAIIGVAYVVLASPCLLPGGKGSSCRKDEGKSGTILTNIMVKKGFDDNDREDMNSDESEDTLLLGATVMPWSPASGRSVQRSGLRDKGGIYLVNVWQATTGNVHRAVGNSFILNSGDVLYFTGLIEGFEDFCAEHAMEILTSDTSTASICNRDNTGDKTATISDEFESDDNIIISSSNNSNKNNKSPTVRPSTSCYGRDLRSPTTNLPCVRENDDWTEAEINNTITGLTASLKLGYTRESIRKSDNMERSREIARMEDMIRGFSREEPTPIEDKLVRKSSTLNGRPSAYPSSMKKCVRSTHQLDGHKVVIMTDHDLGLIVVAIESKDRPGLLLDVSKGLLKLNLYQHHSEAALVNDGNRCVSIWRCGVIEGEPTPGVEEIWVVLNDLLDSYSRGSIWAAKTVNAKVIRATVTNQSTLNGQSIDSVDFLSKYDASIVVIQRTGKSIPATTASGSGTILQAGDLLILKANESSLLLKTPPAGFYETVGPGKLSGKKSTNSDLEHGNFPPDTGDLKGVEVWKDLQVLIVEKDKDRSATGSREFLAAMEIASRSKLVGRTAAESGLDKLTGVFLVSIDRPREPETSCSALSKKVTRISTVVMKNIRETVYSEQLSNRSTNLHSLNPRVSLLRPAFTTIAPDEPLQVGDLLWFAGCAGSIGDLRKIPGLESYQSDEVKEMHEHEHDRRLLEAVISRRGPLVGKTVAEIGFRDRYNAVVIAVHRNGNRVHEHPSRIRLRAGDVLLLEAGPTFMKGSCDHDNSFSLLAEVKDSTPPRLRLFVPALIITILMLIVYTVNLASLVICGLAASMLMIAMGILSEQEARDAVNWEIFITIGSAFGIGTALVNSGVANALANFLVKVGTSVPGSWGVIAAVYFATFLLSAVVTNNAAAALLFPIALDAAAQTGVDEKKMAYTLMLGASASFMTPFGYQTNMMVYGVGGYTFNDFLLIGTPMQIVLWIASVILLSLY